MIVHIDTQLADIIRHQASLAYPHECCGLLTGEPRADNVLITGVHPSKNVTSGDPARSFEIDPKARFDLMRLIESMNDETEIIGHYHSHPDNPAEPSATDLSMVYEPDFIWMICSSSKDGANDIGVFRPNKDISAFNRLTCIIE